VVGNAFQEALAASGDGTFDRVFEPWLDIGAFDNDAVAVDVDKGVDVAVTRDAFCHSLKSSENSVVGEAGFFGKQPFYRGKRHLRNKIKSIDDAVCGQHVGGAEGGIAAPGRAEGISSDGRPASLGEPAGAQDGERAAHGMACEKEGLVAREFERSFNLAPGAAENRTKAQMNPAIVFAALDKANDGIRDPGGKGHRIRAAEGEDGVSITDAKKAARARDRVAEGDGFQTKPLRRGGAGRTVVGDVGCVREIERIDAVEGGVVGMKGEGRHASPLQPRAGFGSIHHAPRDHRRPRGDSGMDADSASFSTTRFSFLMQLLGSSHFLL